MFLVNSHISMLFSWGVGGGGGGDFFLLLFFKSKRVNCVVFPEHMQQPLLGCCFGVRFCYKTLRDITEYTFIK